MKLMAQSEIDVYLLNPAARYPVLIPRRFWRELGRVVDPRFGLPSNNEADSPPEDPH